MSADQLNENLVSVKSIGMIQLSRFGDIIQTLQAANALKMTNPKIRLVLICRESFGRPLEFLTKTVFDEVVYLNYDKILGNGETLLEAQSNLSQFIHQINQLKLNVSINFTYSKVANYLNTVIKSEFKLGPKFDTANKVSVQDKWSQYVMSVVQRGAFGTYNIVDIFMNVLGIERTQVPTPRIKRDAKEIIIHPFASHERKAWSSKKWADCLSRLLSDLPNITLTVVGTKAEEKNFLEMIGSINHPEKSRIKSLVGKANLQELYHKLERSDLFLGHDSMVGHLASLAGTQTITLSLGTVRPIESSPYQDNSYVLSPRTKCFPCFPTDECALTACHRDIPTQLVAKVASLVYQNKEVSTNAIKTNVPAFYLDSANVSRSDFSEIGFYKLNTISSSFNNESDIYKTFYRILWTYTYQGKEESIVFPNLNRNTHNHLLESLKRVEKLYQLAEFGKTYSRYILEELNSTAPSVEKIKDFSQKIDEIDQLQLQLISEFPNLSPLVEYYSLVKHNIPGENLVELCESSYMAYHEFSTSCSVMFELIEKTIQDYKLKTQPAASR